MAVKFLTLIACLLALTQVKGLQVNSEGNIKVTTVTTAGCTDAVRFITDQLSVAYRLYGRFLEVEFVPWGRSTWDGVGEISCQFGRNDCWANRVHRCVLNMLRNNQDALMHYMACEFSATRPAFLQGSYQCPQAVGVNLVDLDHCVVNNLDDLDRAAQSAAATPMAIINFVPAIVLNDSIDRDLHQQARSRLVNMVCLALAADPTSGIQVSEC